MLMVVVVGSVDYRVTCLIVAFFLGPLHTTGVLTSRIKKAMETTPNLLGKRKD